MDGVSPARTMASASVPARSTRMPGTPFGCRGGHDRPGEPEPGRFVEPAFGLARPGGARRRARSRRTRRARPEAGDRAAPTRWPGRWPDRRPGSLSRTPPTTDANTSSRAKGRPARRSSTASSSDSRPCSNPWAERRGWGSPTLGDQRLELDEQRALPFERRAPRPSRGCRGGGRRGTARSGRGRRRARLAHLEQSELAGGPEPMLRRRAAAGARGGARLRTTSTVSTMCSSTRGPASPPSLVTWPTSTTVRPRRRFASWTRRWAHSRTCTTEPGAEGRSASAMVWIESIDDEAGLEPVDRGEHRAEVGLGVQPQLVAHRPEPFGAQPAPAGRSPRPRRRARLPGQLGDAAGAGASTCRSPGSPPSSVTDPGTSPPPSTRSSSAMPGRGRVG